MSENRVLKIEAEASTADWPGVADPEIVSPRDRLWQRLRRAQLLDLRFVAGHKIAGNVVDFYCHDVRLAIICMDREETTNPREWMEATIGMGIKTLRFTPADLEKRMGHVLETIAEVASIRLSRRPPRSRSNYMRE
jgi:very-short-patch-repair endonuclease